MMNIETILINILKLKKILKFCEFFCKKKFTIKNTLLSIYVVLVIKLQPIILFPTDDQTINLIEKILFRK